MSQQTQVHGWEAYRYCGVRCEFRPRAEYKGMPAKPGLMEKTGTRFVLHAMWLMGDDDPYPGEYALSTLHSCNDLMKELGISWVASGDVIVLPKDEI